MRFTRLEKAYQESFRVNHSMHFLLTGKQRAKKLNSTADYDDDCLCGNGSFHAPRTTLVSKVTCTSCLEVLATKPEYLSNG